MKIKLSKAFLLVLLIAGFGLAFIYRDQFNAELLENWVRDAGAAGPIIFMLLYVAGTVFFFPGSVLTLAGGALFGPVAGTFYNLTAATIGAVISFIAARYLAHDWVEQKTGGRLKSLKQGVEEEGWKFVAFVRLVPLFPFNLLNYALGLTRIKLKDYAIASYLCMLPGALAYTYMGYVGREALSGDEAVIQKLMLGLAMLALVGFLPGVVARLRAKPMISVDELKQKLLANDDFLLLDVRTAEDFVGDQGHIEQAHLIPLEALGSSLDKIADYQEKTVITICRTDRRSAKAAQLLAKKGFADVHVVRQGMTDWISNGYPVSKKPAI